MLVLARTDIDDDTNAIRIGDDIKIYVLSIEQNKVKIGIDAPRAV